MKSLSEQIRELEERAEQLERERDAQITLNRMMLSDEAFYRERCDEFRQLLAAQAAQVNSKSIVHGRAIVDVTPAMIRRVNWN